MAIDTTNEKLAVMEWDEAYEPAIPLSPGTFGQDDKQQLLWGNPFPVWGAPAAGPSGGAMLPLIRRRRR